MLRFRETKIRSVILKMTIRGKRMHGFWTRTFIIIIIISSQQNQKKSRHNHTAHLLHTNSSQNCRWAVAVYTSKMVTSSFVKWLLSKHASRQLTNRSGKYVFLEKYRVQSCNRVLNRLGPAMSLHKLAGKPWQTVTLIWRIFCVFDEDESCNIWLVWPSSHHIRADSASFSILIKSSYRCTLCVSGMIFREKNPHVTQALLALPAFLSDK